MLGRKEKAAVNEIQVESKKKGGSQKQNPYIEHKEEQDDRSMNQAVAKYNWQTMCRILAALLAISIGFNGYSQMQSKYIPYVVLKDQLGHIISVGVADKANPIDDKRVIRNEMIEWVENARTIIGDEMYQKKIMNRVYARTPSTGKAKKLLDDFYHDRKPFETAKTESVEASVTLALPSSNTWDVEWTETRRNLAGEIITKERWKGKFTVELSAQDTEDGIRKNGAGFFVTSFTWTKQI